MRFSKEYKKLSYPVFTTIRRNRGYYKEGQKINVLTPEQNFRAEVVSIRPICKVNITKTVALRDADCEPGELIKMLTDWYGSKSNHLILITLMKIGE